VVPLLDGVCVAVEVVVHRGRIVHHMIRLARWQDAQGRQYRAFPAILPNDIVLSQLDFSLPPLPADATAQQRMQHSTVYVCCRCVCAF
jgi:hypothetical protein